MARASTPNDIPPGEAPPIDANQIVAYNLRAARELHGWTQEFTAERLQHALGTRVSQGTVSSMERSWDSTRPRREFTFQDIVAFSTVFDLPMIFFQLPPPGDRREIKNVGRSLDQLYILLLGDETQLEPVYDRLRRLGIRDPNPDERIFERITGEKSTTRKESFRERRKEMLLAYLRREASELDEALDKLKDFFVNASQLGVRGLISTAAKDPDYSQTTNQQTTGPGDAAETENPA